MAGEISAEHWQEELFKHRWGWCFDLIRAVIKGQAGVCLATMCVETFTSEDGENHETIKGTKQLTDSTQLRFIVPT